MLLLANKVAMLIMVWASAPISPANGRQMPAATIGNRLSQITTTTVLATNTGRREKRRLMNRTLTDWNHSEYECIDEKRRQNVHVTAKSSTSEDNKFNKSMSAGSRGSGGRGRGIGCRKRHKREHTAPHRQRGGQGTGGTNTRRDRAQTRR